MRFSKLPKDEVIENPGGLLCKIATNVVLDMKRKRKTAEKFSVALKLHFYPKDGDVLKNEPIDELSASQIEHDIAELSKRLSPFERAVLAIYRDGKKLTQEEIAEQLPCSVFAIRRAVASIRKASKDI